MRKLLVAVGLLACLATPAFAAQYCYVEAAAGGAIGANKLEGGGYSATVATDGMTAGLGVGCDYLVDRFVLGGLARASLDRITGTIDATKLRSSDLSYMIAARAGFMINGSSLVYGLAGYKFQDLRIDVTTLDGKGLVLGGGFETDLGLFRIGLEGTRSDLGTFTDATSGDRLNPVDYRVMGTVKYLFHFGQ